MVPWHQAYERIRTSEEWATRFGRMYRMDEFRYYAYVLRFDALLPALLAASFAVPNEGDEAVTAGAILAPTTPLVPGPPAEALLDFPAGAVILGISACASKLQYGEEFAYAPSNHKAKLDLFSLDLRFSDTDPIVGRNPVVETVTNPNSATQTAPPINADALLGTGMDTDTPARELYVTPGLGILVTVRSMVLPNFIPAGELFSITPDPNLMVHLVFHSMIPGIVTESGAEKAA